jgi:predicted alpha/beta hydrolase family esterase
LGRAGQPGLAAAGARRAAGGAGGCRAAHLRAGLRNFAPIPTEALPFPSQVVSSDNDPAVSVPRALYLAQAWGAEAGLLSNAGHINVKSGHERWEQGFAYLYRLQAGSSSAHCAAPDRPYCLPFA